MNINQLPTGEHTLMLPGAVGDLEGVITVPKTARPAIAGVVCHPHPQFGGTLHNKVAHTLAKVLRDLDMVTVRFNFRGVGKSDGEFGNGIGEQEDLRSILHHLQHEGYQQIYLAGFSFGAGVALQVAAHFPKTLNCSQLITVAPAVNHFVMRTPVAANIPWVLAQGEADEVVAPQLVFDWIDTLAYQPDILRFPGVGHFFHGALVHLHETLLNYLKR